MGEERNLSLCNQCDNYEPDGEYCNVDTEPETVCPQVSDDCTEYEPLEEFHALCIKCKRLQKGKRRCRAGKFQFDPEYGDCSYFEEGLIEDEVEEGDSGDDGKQKQFVASLLKAILESKESKPKENSTEEEEVVVAEVKKSEKDTEQKEFKNIKVDVKHNGTEIILPSKPANMSLDTAIKTLQLRKKEEETEVSIREPMEAFPWDGAFCFFQAMSDMFGWAQAVPTKSFFGDYPPQVISIDVGYDQRADIIWGEFQIPGIKGVLNCSTETKDGRRIFCIGGWTLRKHHPLIKELAEKTREYLKTKSIYRGKAFRIFTRDDGTMDYDRQPAFIDAQSFRPEELIFSEELEEQINTNLFTPIKATDACRKNKIPLRRGILLEGPFGTGKTLTAGATAKLCEENDWTFIILDKVQSLKAALEFARLYPPAVVFGEDIDRATSGDRTSKLDEILNIIDGVVGKRAEIITVLTTNDVASINQAMLRPGRLDAVIPLRAPDAKAVEKLVQVYSRNLLPENADLTEIGVELQGQIPAVIRETIERAKLYAISRTGGDVNGKNIKLAESDLVHAARGMKNHLELLNRPTSVEPSPEEQLGKAFSHVVKTQLVKPLEETVDKTEKTVTKIARRVC